MLVKFKRLKHFIYTSTRMTDGSPDVLNQLEFNSEGLKIQFLYWHGTYTYLIDLYCNDNRKETYSKVFRVCEAALKNNTQIAFKNTSFYPKYLPRYVKDRALCRFYELRNLIKGPDGEYKPYKVSTLFIPRGSVISKLYIKYKELNSSFVLVEDLKTLESEIRKVHGSANIDYVMRENCEFPAIAHIDDRRSNVTVSVISISEVISYARLV